MKCKYCGFEQSELSVFCMNCGAYIKNDDSFVGYDADYKQSESANDLGKDTPRQQSYNKANPASYPIAQQGYAPPQYGYMPPQQGYAPPQQGYGSPQQGYGSPQQGYAPPQQGYASPQQGYGSPQQGYAPPQQEYAPPQQGYTSPQQGYVPPPPQPIRDGRPLNNGSTLPPSQPPPQYNYGQQEQKPAGVGISIASMIIGIVSILCVSSLLGMFLGILALSLGCVSFQKLAELKVSKGNAYAGIILGSLGIIISLFNHFIYFI